MCSACEDVGSYANRKIDKCPFHEAKPVCADCRIHCYGSAMRDQIKDIMRYSGPRIIVHHPWLATLHILDKILSRVSRRTKSEPV
jgi:hypothetical protein